MNKVFSIAVAVTVAAMPVAVQAQGLVGGAEHGAARGEDAAGPIGGIVGGALGAATGTVGGILGVGERPRFREYVTHEHVPSYSYDEDLQVGAVLPPRGVEYYSVPDEYHVRPSYRYTVVNGHPVLVDPETRRIVEVLE